MAALDPRRERSDAQLADSHATVLYTVWFWVLVCKIHSVQ